MSKINHGIQFYERIRDEFLGGKSVRTIALEEAMEPTDILDFLRWLGREHDIERAIRTDQLLAKLMEGANEIAAQMRAAIKDKSFEYAEKFRLQLREQLKLYEQVSGMNAAWVEHKRKVPQGGRPGKERAAQEIGQEPEREPTGGLEAALERTKTDNGNARSPRRRARREDPAPPEEENPFDAG